MPAPRAILTYHSIDDSRSVISTSEEVLERHIRSLASGRIRAMELVDLLERPQTGPAAALTFDDGFTNFYLRAFPLLAENGLTATVFLVAGLCGQESAWDHQPARFRDRGLLSWSKIQELHNAGIRFGAHSMTHRPLTALSPEQARAEILDSRRLIEDRIGEPVECFAYPYGLFSPGLADVVAENFRFGLSTEMGYLHESSKPEALERIDAYYLRNPYLFERLFEPLGRSYVAARALGRRLRGRLAD